MGKKIEIIFCVDIGRLSIALFNTWLGFEYKDLELAKRLDVGYFKFWWDVR